LVVQILVNLWEKIDKVIAKLKNPYKKLQQNCYGQICDDTANSLHTALLPSRPIFHAEIQ